MYAAWDGEEPALLGSTEWVETHLEELQRHAVAYLNPTATPWLSRHGRVPLAERFVNDVARDINDPETGLSRLDAEAGAGHLQAPPAERDSALGRGSAASPRWDRDPTSRRFCSTRASRRSISDSAARMSGIYHSVYDDFYFYTHFLDKDFLYGRRARADRRHGGDSFGGRRRAAV